jgi:poly(3-hydroxyalkanoate) synthetase
VAVGRARDLIAGIRAYQYSPIQRAPEMNDVPVVWQRGTTRLLDYSRDRIGAPILIVPSLINRFDVMDLEETHSFLRYVAAQGFRPFVVDWSEPGKDEADFFIGDYVTERLVPIFHFLRNIAPQIHVLGYCMGGLLALALANLYPEETRSLTLFAMPWHTGSTTVDETTNLQKILLASGDEFLDLLGDLEKPIQKLNYLPVSLLQVLFACVQPAYAIRKFAGFAKRDKNSMAAKLFVLTEDWLNDGIPLTPNVTRELFGDIYGRNVTGKIQWNVGGKIVDPRTLEVPSYIVVAGKDKIVPRESALPMARLIRGSTLVEPPFGHVGLMSGAKAPREVWAPYVAWLAGR